MRDGAGGTLPRMGFITGVITLLGFLWSLVLLGLELFVSVAATVAGVVVPATLAAGVASVVAVVVAVGLFGSAVVLNLGGVDDVYGTLNGRLFDDADQREPSQPETIPDVSPEVVTDDADRFSKSAFQSATGLTPPEFIHLFIRTNGGRVRQTTVYRCLPWSKSTACRYLDELEAEGKVTRVAVGGRNVVCTAESAPDRPE